MLCVPDEKSLDEGQTRHRPRTRSPQIRNTPPEPMLDMKGNLVWIPGLHTNGRRRRRVGTNNSVAFSR